MYTLPKTLYNTVQIVHHAADCFIIAPLCECDQRILMTIFVLRNSNNTTLSSGDVLTSASLPILLSSLTQQPHTPPPDLYGGSRPARGGAGKPNTPPRGFQHQFPRSYSRGWLNSYSLPGVNSINNSAITSTSQGHCANRQRFSSVR